MRKARAVSGERRSTREEFGRKNHAGWKQQSAFGSQKSIHDARTALLPKPKTQQLACPGEVCCENLGATA
jgi:hypothetical protein